jgi:hypothetical protein
VRFKTPGLTLEYRAQVEPELYQLLEDFCAVSKRWALPEPLLNELGRTPAQNKAVGGAEHSLHLWEPNPAGLALPYRTRAADLSVRPYGEAQLELALTWLHGEVAKRGGKRCWELLHHNVLTGSHIHVARDRETGGAE